MNPSLIIESAVAAISQYYSSLSPACQADFARLLHFQQYEKPTTLVTEGQMASKTYFILEGAARAYYLKNGKDITDWLAFDHEFICAIDSFFLMVPSDLYVELLSPSTLLEIDRADMQALCDQYHDFDRLCRVITTKTMLQQRQKLVAIQFETAQQKFENMERIRPDITQRVPLGHIASYLGMTIETLSRIRNRRRRI
jgi:CRP-like cAMP-binding protein